MRALSIVLLTAGCAFALSGAPASVGVVRSYGEFKVDGASVRGNSTLLAGDVVESTTANATANVGTAEVTLLPSSRAAVYTDHTTLQKGTAIFKGTSHALDAGTLHVVPTSANSLVGVGYNDLKSVTVSAQSGGADVFSSGGVLLASVAPGASLAFEPLSAGAASGAAGQADANAPVHLKGKLIKERDEKEKKDKYFVIMDGKKYEVTSTTLNLNSYVGKVITATAAVVTVTAVATVVTVSTISVVAAVAAAGLSTAAIAGIVVAGATGGIVGGLGASGAFSSASTK